MNNPTNCGAAMRFLLLSVACLALTAFASASPARAGRNDGDQGKKEFWLARFSADVTIPLGHRCMGIQPIKAQKIVDPLQVHGFVLLGSGDPIVLAAVDWCEIRNGAYDQWRDALAKAAGTSRERVLVTSLHQHDAPVVDAGAAALLAGVGMADEMYDVAFHKAVLERVAAALKAGLPAARRVTHLGLGQAKVIGVASSRRIEHPDGRVDFSRYSRSGGNAFLRDAPEGLIDPWLKTVSFWDGDQPLLALHAYAVHPMSYYGKGGVSYDFVGMARERRARDDARIAQIYVSGCSGDLTAGKYNDGSPANRPVLADKIYQAMKAAWKATKRQPLEKIDFRNTQFSLDFHEGEDFREAALQRTLANRDAKERDRILAAMGLSSLRRISSGRKIDMPCVDLGPAQIVLLPGEAFVGYQLMAQRMRADSFVVAIGYGECWPGYIPTKAAFEDKFGHGWRWVAPGAEARLKAALRHVLAAPK